MLIKNKDADDDEEAEVDDDDGDGDDDDDGDLCLGGQSYEGMVEEGGVGKVGFLTTPETLSSSSLSSLSSSLASSS